MRIGTLTLRAALVATLAATSVITATTAQAAGAAHVRGTVRASHCATVIVKAKPSLNTAMIPETITSRVTNCSSTTETVTLKQNISGPTFGTPFAGTKTWKFTVRAGHTVTRTRSFPYACCGSYTVTDNVYSSAGKHLAKASAAFTFA